MQIKCPHCGIAFHEDWQSAQMLREKKHPVLANIRNYEVSWGYETTRCPNCGNVTIKIGAIIKNGAEWVKWRTVYPIGTNRAPVSPEVPSTIATDYIEACTVLPFSAKASAALSRRCLQAILHEAGYRGRDLNAEIDLLLNEADPKKAIPARLHETVDTIRHFGNFSAHPINDKTALQIIEVEPEEAEWCLEILEECFEHFYVGPATVRARKATLDAKLAKAGKPVSK